MRGDGKKGMGGGHLVSHTFCVGAGTTESRANNIQPGGDKGLASTVRKKGGPCT